MLHTLENVEKLEEILLENLRTETFLQNLLQAMSVDEKAENFEFIARMFDIDIDDIDIDELEN